MSYGKFAPMTSALLVRKGEATPSVVAGQIGPQGIGASSAPALERPAIKIEPATQSGPHIPKEKRVEKPVKSATDRGERRRVVLTLSQAEFQRLGIVAVKKNMKRQEFAREALFAHLAAAASELGACRCIATGEDCDCK